MRFLGYVILEKCKRDWVLQVKELLSNTCGSPCSDVVVITVGGLQDEPCQEELDRLYDAFQKELPHRKIIVVGGSILVCERAV